MFGLYPILIGSFWGLWIYIYIYINVWFVSHTYRKLVGTMDRDDARSHNFCVVLFLVALLMLSYAVPKKKKMIPDLGK
jgi:hypothetical protein